MYMLARIRWPNVIAALVVTVVLLAVIAWPALEPDPPALPPGPATAIRPSPPATPTPTPPPPERTGHDVPGGFERQAPSRRLLAQARDTGSTVGRAAPTPTPRPPRPRPAPPAPAPGPIVTAAPVSAPAPVYAPPPPHREFETFEH
ncbi:MAG: hypothetical protein QOF76_3838 [Solirubrobacteraceae bacterium]|nr:hypothetical protein [Solirubrobacteraceae bacterium]